MEIRMPMDWDLGREELTCRSYLEKLVDAFEDDDPCYPDQLEKIWVSSMLNVLPQEATAPSLLHNKRQP